jgi:hypothetical protein
LDNNKFVRVDLANSNAETLTQIATGTGGFMPRYIWRRMAETGKFAMIVLRMKDARVFDYVQLFFTDDV